MTTPLEELEQLSRRYAMIAAQHPQVADIAELIATAADFAHGVRQQAILSQPDTLHEMPPQPTGRPQRRFCVPVGYIAPEPLPELSDTLEDLVRKPRGKYNKQVSADDVLEHVRRRPGLASTQISNELTEASTTVFMHLQRLVSLGLVKREGSRPAYYYPAVETMEIAK